MSHETCINLRNNIITGKDKKEKEKDKSKKSESAGSGGEKESKSAEEKRKQVKSLIDKIPTQKDQLFQYKLDTSQVRDYGYAVRPSS